MSSYVPLDGEGDFNMALSFSHFYPSISAYTLSSSSYHSLE